jgi:phosphatidylglycerol---prolipoprotein diacylglyceryl transferase
MIDFLHNHTPEPVLLEFAGISIYFYGLLIVTGILAAIFVVFRLADAYGIKKNDIIDLTFWLVLAGIIGARLYHVALEWPYYLDHPWAALMVWQGGLAIHGALVAGILVIVRLARSQGYGFWKLAAVVVPGLSLAQAIGRWGNYFNQEVYGRPTDQPWGIPIEPVNRLPEFYNFSHFHPAFLYESLLDLGIFAILISLHYGIIKKARPIKFESIVLSYLFLYSLVRFLVEYIRIDYTPVIWGLRWPQLLSVLIMAIVYYFALRIKKNETVAGGLAKN